MSRGVALLVSVAIAACSPSGGDARGPQAAPASAPSLAEVAGGAATPPRMRVRVLAEYPHDPQAFTQGLLWHEGSLYESVGRYGRSALRQVEVETGAVLREAALPPHLFGEGLALVGGRLVQLTWREGRALVYDLRSFALEGERRYDGEGWGLAFGGGELWMSDGSARLTRRDPEDFAVRGTLEVNLAGRPLALLNELEWAQGALWANLLGDDRLARIDPRSGAVTALVEAGGLLSPAEARGADVLNGIAHDPERGVFYLTGKLWPKLFEVTFEAAPAS